jgi:hypothetical protein
VLGDVISRWQWAGIALLGAALVVGLGWRPAAASTGHPVKQ